jgi:predicted aspartyl protease
MADPNSSERIMGDMGTFRTTILIESAERRGEMRTVENALVDTGSEYTWVPGAVLAELGIAIVHAAGAKAPDFVVFAEAGDLVLLGARSLEGLNVRVDAQRKQLVPAGPILAGAA